MEDERGPSGRRSLPAAATEDEHCPSDGRTELGDSFLQVMETFGDIHASEEVIMRAIVIVEQSLPPDTPEQLRSDWNYWVQAYREIQHARELDPAARTVLSTTQHGMPPHNVSKGMMMATVHLIWRRALVRAYGWNSKIQAFGDPVAAVQVASGQSSYLDLAQQEMRRIMQL